MPILQPGKYNLRNLTAFAQSGAFVNLKDIFVEMTIDESIFSSAISGKILVTDTANLPSGSVGLPLMGNEIIIIELDLPDWYPATYETDPTDDPDAWTPKQNYVFYVGRIYSIQNVTALNDKSQKYEIQFCSEELLRSENLRISKWYKDTPSEIAKKILTKTIGTESRIYFEDTAKVLDVVIPNWHPFYAINWLASRSLSVNSNSPTFFFYQTLYSDYDATEGKPTSTFWYDSLDYLTSTKSLKTFYFGLANVLEDDPSKFLRVENYFVEKRFDSLASISDGLFANRLITHDVVNKKWEIKDQDYYKEFPNWSHTSKGKLYRGVDDSEGKKFTDYPDSKIYMHSVGTPESPNNISVIANRRAAQMATLDSNILNLIGPGDGVVYSGSKISFSYKSPEIFNNINSELTDTFYDGDWIVLSVRHQFFSEKYRVNLRCAKESLKINVEDYVRKV